MATKLLDFHPWLGPASAILMWLLVLVLSIKFAVAAVKRALRGLDMGLMSDAGYPRWLARFVLDDDEYGKPHAQHRKPGPSPAASEGPGVTNS
jgi:hypothetical protein